MLGNIEICPQNLQWLLTKLRHYGIVNCTYNWIQTWLTKCTHYVVLDGECSSLALVLSGMPQTTVLGPLMFLKYIVKDSYHSAYLQMIVYRIELSLLKRIQSFYKKI